VTRIWLFVPLCLGHIIADGIIEESRWIIQNRKIGTITWLVCATQVHEHNIVSYSCVPLLEGRTAWNLTKTFTTSVSVKRI
jgi:hypothetical protein